MTFAGMAALLFVLPLAAADRLQAEAAPWTSRRVAPRILWIAGHNELNPDGAGPDGASDLRKTLEEEFHGRRVEKVHMVDLPADTTDAVVVIAGPKRDFSDEDARKLRALLAGGARLLVCIDPEIEHDRVDLKNLRAVLREAGAEVHVERIVDREAALPEAKSPMPNKAPVRDVRSVFVARFNPADHALLAALPPGARIVFSDACRVAAMSAGTDPFDVREIASTSPSASSNTKAGRGPAGPVLVAGTRRSGPGRFVVAGDATFMTNGFAARTGIKDAPLAIAAIRWLASGMKKKDRSGHPMVLVAAIAVAAVLLAGSVIFSKRS
jgi:hypothetical protein